MIRAARAVGGMGDSGDAGLEECFYEACRKGVSKEVVLPPQTLAWAMAEVLACSWASLSAMILMEKL